MSENYEPIIYSLTDEEGKEQQFEMLDFMEIDGQLYYAMIPYHDDGQDVDEDYDEFVILKEVNDDKSDDDNVFLASIDDEDEYEKIGNMFIENLNKFFE